MGSGVLDRIDITFEAATRSFEEEELDRVREAGQALVNDLCSAINTLRMHAADNQATDYSVGRLRATVGHLVTLLGAPELTVADGEAYVNDIRVRFGAQSYENLVSVSRTLLGHRVGGIRFHRALDEGEARALALALSGPPSPELPLTALREHCATHRLPVTLSAPYLQECAATIAIRELSRAYGTFHYALGVLALQAYTRTVEAQGFAGPHKVRRAIQDLVDFGREHPGAFLRLHTIQGLGDPLAVHSMNVAVLAIAVGRALGLDKVELADLGTAAAFHDIGYARLPGRDDPDAYAAQLRADRQVHPVAGMLILAREIGYADHVGQRMRAALEHHLRVDGTGGYPPLFTDQIGSLSRIIQVCDHYDAMVHPDPEGRSPALLPADALRRIAAGTHGRFDPVAAKALVQVLGRYPAGSVVKLSTGHVGLVVSAGRPGTGFRQPIVRLLRDPDGHPMDRIADLQQPRDPMVVVVQVLRPTDLGLRIRDLLFGEATSALAAHASEPAAPAAPTPQTPASAPAQLSNPYAGVEGPRLSVQEDDIEGTSEMLITVDDEIDTSDQIEFVPGEDES